MTAARMRAGQRLTEAAFQDLIVTFAALHRWWTYHPFDSRRSTAGWPDLVLLRPPEAIFVELKKHDGKVSPEQGRVLEMLEECDLEVHVWRPTDKDAALARLAQPRTTPRSKP